VKRSSLTAGTVDSSTDGIETGVAEAGTGVDAEAVSVGTEAMGVAFIQALRTLNPNKIVTTFFIKSLLNMQTKTGIAVLQPLIITFDWRTCVDFSQDHRLL